MYYCTCGDDSRLEELRDIGATVKTFKPYSECYTLGDRLVRQVRQYQYFRSILRISDEWNADIVHYLFVGGSELSLFLSILKRRSVKSKIFLTDFVQSSTKPAKGPITKIYRIGQRLSIRSLVNGRAVERLFVHHSEVKNKFVKKLSISEEYISVVPDPVYPLDVNKSKQELRKELSLPEEQTLLLFFGGTRPQKGPNSLLESLQYVESENVTVVFAGPARDNIKERIIDIGRERNIDTSIIGRFEFIPDNNVYKYFLASDAVLLPYRSDYRGTSGILQRSIASSRPVVGTKCGTVGKIIKNWNVGIVVEPDSPVQFGQAIDQLIENIHYYNTNVQSIAPKYVEDHHWKNLSSKVLDTYLSCISD